MYGKHDLKGDIYEVVDFLDENAVRGGSDGIERSEMVINMDYCIAGEVRANEGTEVA